MRVCVLAPLSKFCLGCLQALSNQSLLLSLDVMDLWSQLGHRTKHLKLCCDYPSCVDFSESCCLSTAPAVSTVLGAHIAINPEACCKSWRFSEASGSRLFPGELKQEIDSSLVGECSGPPCLPLVVVVGGVIS